MPKIVEPDPYRFARQTGRGVRFLAYLGKSRERRVRATDDAYRRRRIMAWAKFMAAALGIAGLVAVVLIRL